MAEVKVDGEEKAGRSHRMASVHQEYTGPNPFVTTTPPGCFEWFKIILMTCCMIPVIRLFGTILCFLFMYIFARFAVCCKGNRDEPHGCGRKLFTYPIRFLVRVILLLWGFYWIPVTKPPAPCCGEPKKARVIVANHISLVDALKIFVNEGCTAAAKHDVFHYPVLGIILTAMQFVPIDRRTAASRQKAKLELQRRIDDARFPPLLIFPQGTTSNYKVVTKFMTGAFAPGVAVQPVLLRFPHCWWDQAMLGPDHWILWRTLCQVINYETIEYLPVYEPSDAEKKNPVLYANNVQKMFAEKLGAQATSHSWDDVRLYKESRKIHASAETRNFLTDDFKNLAGLSYEQLKAALVRFRALDKDNDGYLDYKEFSDASSLAKFPDDLKGKLFAFIDSDGDGYVDFRGFAVGVAAATGNVPAPDAVRVAFEVFDQNKDGFVDKKELLGAMHELTHKEDDGHRGEVAALVEKIFTSEDERLDLEKFQQAVQKQPQIIALVFALDYVKPPPKAAGGGE